MRFFLFVKLHKQKMTVTRSKTKEKHQNIPRTKRNIPRTKQGIKRKSYDNVYYGQPGYELAVWNLAKTIPGKDPAEWRKCRMTGKVMRYSHRGKNESDSNWDVDHKIPKARGGSDHICNLEAINSSKNRSIGNSMDDKPEQVVKYFDAIREHRGIQDKVHPGFKWRKSIIGKMFLVKASPRTNPELATILDFDNQSVRIAWKYTNWEKRLPLDARLFEPVSDGRPTRNGSVA